MTQADPPSKKDDAFWILADRFLDGAASPEDEAQLGAWLKASPALARALAKRAWLDHEIESALMEQPLAEPETAPPASLSPKTARVKTAAVAATLPFPRRRLAWAAGVALAIGLGASSFASWQGRQKECPVLVGGGEAKWQGAAPAAGKRLGLGSAWVLASGTARLDWDNGATATVAAPACFRVEASGWFGGPGRLRLEEGDLWARCPKAARGFTVATPDGTFRDMGTEFTVMRGKTGPSALVVREGSVEAAPKSGAALLVRAGEAWQVGKVAPSTLNSQSLLIGPRAVWAYWDDDTAPPDGWEKPGFDDSRWKRGKGPFSWGAALGPSTEVKMRHASVSWFRTSFFAASPRRAWRLELAHDDGLAVFLNGKELLRDALPPGPLSARSVASAQPGEQIPPWWSTRYVDLPAGSLLPGENTLCAVSVQAEGQNRDGMLFSLLLKEAKAPVPAGK